MPSPITIRGVDYADEGAVASAFGIGRKSVRNAINRGRVDFIGIPAHITRPKAKPVLMKVRVANRDFDSVEQAARALKVKEATIRGALSRGREEFVGVGKKRGHRVSDYCSPAIKRIPVKIGRREWPSQKQCARELGVGYRRLRRAIQKGETEWLAASLMDLLAREEGRKGKMPQTLDKEAYSQMGRDRWNARKDKEWTQHQ